MRRGTLNYDFIVATILFLIVYVTMIQTSIYSFANIGQGADIFTEESDVLTGLLVKTPGYPVDWESINEVDQLGLTLYRRGNNPNILDFKKLEKINETDCAALKKLTPVKARVDIEFTAGNTTYACN